MDGVRIGKRWMDGLHVGQWRMDGLCRALLLAVASAALACGEAPQTDTQAPERPEGWQATSLFGEDLFQLEDTAGAIADADAALAEAPDDVELIIASGRVRRNFWHYRQAMELYGRAIDLAPDDWRPYRYRGHRHISVREFDAAIRDLESARERAPMNWDVAYHLGLAYFVSGDFTRAADEYMRCLRVAASPEARDAQTDDFRSCAQNADDPESFVAMTEWAVRALMRSGRDAEATEMLAGVAEDLVIETNVAYYHDLLFYKGVKTEDELLDPGGDAPYRLETVGQGVANWLLVQGDTARAVELYERIVDDPWWPGFGRIAGEAELARIRSR
jgi:tetratricopeptide (TPR) repeat protein